MVIKILIVFISASFLLYSQDIADTTIVLSDSTILSDSLISNYSSLVYDSTFYVHKKLSQNSFAIQRDTYLRNDYKYTGNLVEPFPFNFTKDLGLPGQPNETFLYGVGHNGIGYLIDGILINDRRSNELDLYLVQSEDIEMIEIIPSPKGFLFSAWNNPVSLNIITRDFIPVEPYSRIKYYQGPDGEAMVDGSFNSAFSKNFLLSFDITNRKYDSSYSNTAFSIWQAKVKAKYFFSSNFYLIASYNHAAQKTGLWGGVNRDSILSLGLNLDDLLYTSDEAPVNNTTLRQKDLLNFSTVRLTHVQSEDSKTEVSLYHSFKEAKIENGSFLEYDNTTFGININQTFKRSILYFYFAGNFERNTLENWYRYNTEAESTSSYTKYITKLYSVAGSISADIIEKLKPSLFFKISSAYREYGNPGSDIVSSSMGVDVEYVLIDDVTLYAGYSLFDKTFYENDKTSIFEASLKYKTEDVFADVKYFRRDNTNIIKGPGIPSINPVLINSGDMSGLGLSFTTFYLFLQLESKVSAYFANEGELNSVPDFSFIGGLYYRGDLFEDNLNLKTGLKFTYYGNINSITDYYGLTSVGASKKIDFILSGEIRKAAILYFTWENLLGNEYYITPFFPMPGGSIRFGLAWELSN